MSDQKPWSAEAMAAVAGAATGSPYPLPVPRTIQDALMPAAKRVSYEFGFETKRRNILVSDEMMEIVGLCILGAVSCAAHAVLNDRDKLLAAPEVKKWADTANAALCDPAHGDAGKPNTL